MLVIMYASLIASFSNIIFVETVFFTNSKENDLPRYGKRSSSSVLYGLKLNDEKEYYYPFTNDYTSGESASTDEAGNVYERAKGMIRFLGVT